MFQQFFGIIRQAGGGNDHPTSINFLQLYRLLSTYKLIKPPKNGNCTVFEEPTLTSRFTKENFASIFKNQPSKSFRRIHVEEVIQKLIESLPEESLEDEDELLESAQEMLICNVNNECTEGTNINTSNVHYINGFACQKVSVNELLTDSTAHDGSTKTKYTKSSIVFYISGFACRQIRKQIKCQHCLENFSSSVESMFLPAAEMTNLKNQWGGLIYVKENLFKFFNCIEEHFIENINLKSNNNVYKNTVDAVVADAKKLNSPVSLFSQNLCDEHKSSVLGECIHYYVSMRMRQWAKLKTRDVFHQSRILAKNAKLTSN